MVSRGLRKRSVITDRLTCWSCLISTTITSAAFADCWRSSAIDTLMLPYMPLAQRLVVAFEEGSGSAEEVHTQFYLNPVAFLLAQAGPGIGRILFVPPSGREGPPLLPGAPDQPDDDEPDSELRFDTDKPDDRDEVMLLVAGSTR